MTKLFFIKFRLLYLSLQLVLSRIGITVFRRSHSNIKKFFFKSWYNGLNEIIELLFSDHYFMNLGYSAKQEQDVLSQSEKNQLNLYDYLIEVSPLENLRKLSLLEIGSGRGGGTHHLNQQYFPKSASG